MSNAAQFLSDKPDFPDWLSPMLVKELRQGMRSRVFLVSFMTVQAAMIFIALFGLLNAASNDSNTGVTVFYWMVVCISLAIVMPSSGLGAIAREKSANTLEPIFLTHLTARRILIGKWVAIVAQMLLLVAAILPYTVLRYYLGAINLVSELAALGWIVAGSAALTAITVAISPLMGRFGRALVPFGIFLLYIVASIASEAFSPVTRGGGWNLDWPSFVALIVQLCLLPLAMLEVGATKIAPVAENHSTIKRLIGITSVVVAIVYSYSPSSQGWMWLAVIVVAGPILIGANCEPISQIPSVYRPFARRGFAGRMFGRLFYPGWVSGFFYSILVLALAGWRVNEILSHHSAFSALGAHVRFLSRAHPPSPIAPDLSVLHITEVAVVGALFMPVALYRLFRIKKMPAAVFFFLFHTAASVLALIGAMMANYNEDEIQAVVAVIPTCALWYHSVIGNWGDSQKALLVGLSIVAFSSTVILLIRMRPAARVIAALEKSSLIVISPTPLGDAARPVAAA